MPNEAPRLKPIHAAKQVINNFAEDLAAKLEFRPGDPVEPLVRRLGGQILIKDALGSAEAKPESIVVYTPSSFIVFLPSMTSLERDRFTIAHELGHLFLHFPSFAKENPGVSMVATRWVDEGDAEQQRAEWEANWFAAGFVMPSSQFIEFFNASGKDLRSVAIRFGVSQHAATVRAKTLNLMQ